MPSLRRAIFFTFSCGPTTNSRQHTHYDSPVPFSTLSAHTPKVITDSKPHTHAQGRHAEAEALFAEAGALDPTNHIYPANRAAALEGLGRCSRSTVDPLAP
jgi:hypothetical protein